MKPKMRHILLTSMINSETLTSSDAPLVAAAAGNETLRRGWSLACAAERAAFCELLPPLRVSALSCRRVRSAALSSSASF